MAMRPKVEAVEELHRLIAQSGILAQEVAVADFLQVSDFLRFRLAGEIIPRVIEEFDEPRSGVIGHGELLNHGLDWTGFGVVCKGVAAGNDRVAGDQPVRAKGLAVEVHALSQAERRIELAVKGGIEALSAQRRASAVVD